jgi:hypothetical protein
LQAEQAEALQSVDLPTQAQVVVVQVATEQPQDLASVHPLLSKSVQAVEKARMELIRSSHLSPQQAVVLVEDNLLVMVRQVVQVAARPTQAAAAQAQAARHLQQVKAMQVLMVHLAAQHRLVAVELVAQEQFLQELLQEQQVQDQHLQSMAHQ